MPTRKKIFYGWWIVLASLILNIFAGGTFFYGFTVFFNPIKDTFRWSAAATSFAFVFQRLEAGVVGPIAGFLVDRVGPRKLMLVGWSIIGLGFLMMSRINSLWAFYGSFVLIATGLSFGSFIVMNTVIAHWFTKKRSRALTLISVGFGASGALVPLISLSIGYFGWRETLSLLGIILWPIGILLSLVMKHKPSQYGYLPDGELRPTSGKPANAPNSRSPNEIGEQDLVSSTTGFTAKAVLRTRAFWILTLAFFFQHIGISAVMVHIVPYLESVKLSRTISATAVTGMTLCSIIGRLGFGFLGDFTNKRYLIATALTLQAAGLVIFSFIDASNAWLVILFLIIYAPGYGGALPLRQALQADYFGTRSFGTIMGLMASVSMLGGLFSPVVAGWFFDVTGSYQLIWQIFAVITIPAILLLLLAKPPEVTQEP